MKKHIISFSFIISMTSIFSQVEILNENFQTGMPINWEIINQNPSPPVDPAYVNGWIVIADPENNSDSVIASTSYFSPIGVSNNWLITPQITLGNYGNFLYWDAKSHDASFPDDYLILLSKTGKLMTDFIDTIGSIHQENFEWISRSTNLNNPTFLGQDIYIAFVNTTNNGFKLYLDSIIVTKNDPVSLTEINSSEISIFPNPVTEYLQIQSPFEVSFVSIKNTSGQVLIEQNSNNKIDTSLLSPGYYIIEITAKGYTIKRKFLKID